MRVRKYLEDYCDHFSIRPLIRFETRVVLVEPNAGGWRVVSTDQRTGTVTEESFDAVIVCNGHYAVPHHGEIQNIEKFQVWKRATKNKLSFFLQFFGIFSSSRPIDLPPPPLS